MKANGLDVPVGMTQAEALEALREKGESESTPPREKVVFKDKKEEEKDVVELDTVIPNPKEGEVASIFEEALIPDETGTKTDTKKKEEGPEAGFVDTTKQKETIVEEDNIDDEDAYAQVEEAFSDKIDETDPFRISKRNHKTRI